MSHRIHCPAPTPQQQNSICAFIRAGGFPDVAAQAAGVPPAHFHEWMRIGTENRINTRRLYTDFVAQVNQAIAEARLTAEIAVFKLIPLGWLKFGPGKQTPDSLGWTTTVRPTFSSDKTTNLIDPAMASLLQSILPLLRSCPEARARIAAFLSHDDSAPPSPPPSDGLTPPPAPPSPPQHQASALMRSFTSTAEVGIGGG